MRNRKVKNIKKHQKFQKGFALVEVVAALGVATIAITALVSLSISTLRTSLNSKLLLEGTKVANREIELVRAFRDSRTWEEFITALDSCDTGPCHIDESGNVAGGADIQNPGDADELSRSFQVSDSSGGSIDSADNVVRVSVSVTWSIGDQQKGAYIYTDLSNWRGR